MTSFLRAYGSVPLCVLLCSALALCSQDPGAGELKLIRANYRRSQQLPYIFYLVKRTLRILTSHPTHLCSLQGSTMLVLFFDVVVFTFLSTVRSLEVFYPFLSPFSCFRI